MHACACVCLCVCVSPYLRQGDGVTKQQVELVVAEKVASRTQCRLGIRGRRRPHGARRLH